MGRKFQFIIVILVGLGFGLNNFLDTYTDRQVTARGTDTVATVVGRDISTHRKSATQYYLQLQFPIADGSLRSEEVQVPSSIYEQTESNPRVPIRYLYLGSDTSGEPVVRIKGQSEGTPVWYYIAALVMIAGGVGLWFEFFPRRKAATSAA
jgi:hypothetical protein